MCGDVRTQQKNQVIAEDWILAQKVSKTIVHFDHLLSLQLYNTYRSRCAASSGGRCVVRTGVTPLSAASSGL